MFTVKTDIRKTAPGTYVNDLLREGSWGAVEFRFDQYRACIALEAPVRDNNFDVPARVVFQKVEKDEEDDKYADRADKTRLGRILAMEINGASDNRVYFGLKEMGRDPLNDRNTVLGFNFMEFEVDFLNPDNGKKDQLVIVAVKVNDMVRDVGSPFILAQRVHFPDPELYDWFEY
jgi:hypothetical protein